MDNPSVGQYSREISSNNRAYFLRLMREIRADAPPPSDKPSQDDLLKLQAKFRRSVQNSLARETKR